MIEVVRASPIEELIAIDEALTALGRVSERQARVVELRFFGGLQIEEITPKIGLAEKPVRRDGTRGRAFRQRLLAKPA